MAEAKLVRVKSFDVDHTAYPGPSTLHTLGEHAAAGAFLHDPESMTLVAEMLAVRQAAETGDGDMMPYLRKADKAYLLLTSRLSPEARQAGALATAKYIEANMYDPTRTAIEDGKKNGDVVVLISNGPDLVIHALGEILGVAAIGRKPEEYVLGSHHAKMSKWKRLTSYCAEELGLYLEADPAVGIEQNALLEEHWGDSPADLPLLERAVRPVTVNPNMGLETIADERGWEKVLIGDAPFYGDLSHTFQPRSTQQG